MGWWQQTKRRIAEALVGGGWNTGVDYDDAGYRRLTGRAEGPRDLAPHSQDTMLRVCRWQYDSHPLAGWMVDQRVGLICGDELGFSVTVDPTVSGLSPEGAKALAGRIKKRLESFWDSPIYSWRYRADEMFTSYLVDGELCLPVASRNEMDGLPQIDMVDTARIKAIRMKDGSGLIAETVVLMPPTPGAEDPTLAIVRMNPATQRLEGGCFFFRHSRLANATRGRSATLRQADWIDIIDQGMFARADKFALANTHVWDVTLKGAAQPQIDAKIAEIAKNPPTKPGTVRVHNENETWDAITPDLRSEDATTELKHIQNFVLGSGGYPESWFGGGGEVTRTTAGEQNDVALMMLRRDRKQVRTMFGTLLHFAYDCLSEKNPRVYPPRLATGINIEIDLPPLDEKDISKLGGVVQNIVAALEQAVSQEFISRERGREVFLHVVDRLGVPVDPDTEEETIKRERDTDELTIAARAQAAAAASAMGQQPATQDDDTEDEDGEA